MNNKAVLILGAGLMQEPAIRAAKELGFKTVVVDGNPAAICASLADRFENIDLKDKERLLDFARELKGKGPESELAGVFTAGTDFSANVAYVAENLGLPGHKYESCLNASNKVRMRSCFLKEKVPSPQFEEVDSNWLSKISDKTVIDQIKFPKVLKPVDNMGGRGCRIVREKDELEEALLNAIKYSRTSKAIFEDFMDGPEFSIDSIVYKGTLTITGFADRHIYYPPYFIETGHTMPSQFNDTIKNQLIATFALGIKALGLTEGVAKADIKYTKNGPMIGEIAARLSGGYMSGWTFPYSSNCFLTQEALKIACGMEPDYILRNREPVDWQPHESVKDYPQSFKLFEIKSQKVSAERAWISIPGKIKKIAGINEAENVQFVTDVLPRSKEGDPVNFPRNNVEKCGNIITLAPNYVKAVSAAEKAVSEITIFLENNNEETEKFLQGYFAADEENFPPSAFDFPVDFTKVGMIPADSKVINFIPEEFNDQLCKARDWNHCSLQDVINRFDYFMPEHKELDGKAFWKACMRGSIQGMLYTAGK